MIVNMMKNGTIDFHTHAFPDELAPRAMKKLLSEAPGVNAFLDGTINGADGFDESQRHQPKRDMLHRHDARTVHADFQLVQKSADRQVDNVPIDSSG